VIEGNKIKDYAQTILMKINIPWLMVIPSAPNEHKIITTIISLQSISYKDETPCTTTHCSTSSPSRSLREAWSISLTF